jgi:methyltransferase OMS1
MRTAVSLLAAATGALGLSLPAALPRRHFIGALGGLALGPPAACAAAPEYDKFAATYDALDGGAAADGLGLSALRQELCAPCRGRTLEVAVGTGLNLPNYAFDQGIETYIGTDLSLGMLGEAKKRASTLGPYAARAGFSEADASKLPFSDSQFDNVVTSFSLCVFDDPVACVREMARVCKKDGLARVRLLENTRAAGPLGEYQKLTGPLVKGLSKGCDYSVDGACRVPRVAGVAVGCRVSPSPPQHSAPTYRPHHPSPLPDSGRSVQGGRLGNP